MHPSSLSPFRFLLLLLPFLPASHSYPHPLSSSTPPQPPPQPQDPTASILHTLNLFSQAVDTHNYTLFPAIFAPDARADFDDGKGEIAGLEGITTALAEGLRGKKSWHGLSTQVVEFEGGDGGDGEMVRMGGRARVSSYLQGTFFGQGNLTGEIVTTYGRYVAAFGFYVYF